MKYFGCSSKIYSVLFIYVLNHRWSQCFENIAHFKEQQTNWVYWWFPIPQEEHQEKGHEYSLEIDFSNTATTTSTTTTNKSNKKFQICRKMQRLQTKWYVFKWNCHIVVSESGKWSSHTLSLPLCDQVCLSISLTISRMFAVEKVNFFHWKFQFNWFYPPHAPRHQRFRKHAVSNFFNQNSEKIWWQNCAYVYACLEIVLRDYNILTVSKNTVPRMFALLVRQNRWMWRVLLALIWTDISWFPYFRILKFVWLQYCKKKENRWKPARK